jgi:serpin B
MYGENSSSRTSSTRPGSRGEKGLRPRRGAAVAVKSPAPAVPDLRADHPFLFLIRDRKTGSILFMGRVMNPGE